MVIAEPCPAPAPTGNTLPLALDLVQGLHCPPNPPPHQQGQVCMMRMLGGGRAVIS